MAGGAGGSELLTVRFLMTDFALLSQPLELGGTQECIRAVRFVALSTIRYGMLAHELEDRIIRMAELETLSYPSGWGMAFVAGDGELTTMRILMTIRAGLVLQSHEVKPRRFRRALVLVTLVAL